ncbi:hypothetical protein MN116_007136 [Schistosoma mekongi]|uniref:PDZ domain-containing protein n=1 Tax=Schistosoma mekongi TaxID=38744 RepID=A0AAE2D474_SCHME|nr:hypothetical protein MN116_007136 [Schistosoma mekongi]
MTYVEKRLVLRNGPPWGFRLYEDFMEGLIVAKIRRRSPSEQAGLREGDHVLAINGVDALDMSHAQAVQIIDFASYTLEIIVGRYERHQRSETVFMDNKSLLSKQIPQEITTTELQLFWEKDTPLKPARRNWPPPPPAQEYTPIQATPQQPKRPPLVQTHSVSIHVPAQRPVAISTVPPPQPQPQVVSQPPQPVRQPSIDPPIIPHDPDVASVSVKQLMREFDVPPIAPELKKKNYSDSSFYSDPAKYYPTIEEQIEMARRVANSLHDPYNSESKGACMFEKQRQRAEKHVKEGPEPQPDPIELASPEELEYMTPPEAPPPPPPPPPSFPGLQPTKKQTLPAPPPMTYTPGQPKTVQEFLEKIKIFPKNLHTDLDPQKCFDIASALYTSDSRGAKMFAKRHARAVKWDSQNSEDEKPNNKMNVVMASGPGPTVRSHDQMKMISSLPQTKTQCQQQKQLQLKKQQTPVKPLPVNLSNGDTHTYNKQSSVSSAADNLLTTPTQSENMIDATPKPFIPINTNNNTHFGKANNNTTSATHISNTNNNSDNTLETNHFNNQQFNMNNNSTNESGWRPVKFRIGQTAN